MPKPKRIVVSGSTKKGRRQQKKAVVLSFKRARAPRGMQRSQGRSMADSHRAFNVAIRNPFHPDALGARVPDSYSYPTVCYHINATMQCTPSAGNFEVILLPSPCFTYIVGTGSISGLPSYNQNSFAGYATSPTALAQFLLNWRIVAWGVRIILKDTQTNIKGRVYSATIPLQRSGASYTVYNGSASTNALALSTFATGYPVGTAAPGLIQALSTCQMFSLQDVLEAGTRCVAVSPSHVTQYEFRSSQDQPVYATSVGAGDVITSVPGATAASFHDPVSLAGGAGLVVFASGMETGNVFDLDIVYHLEGTPDPQTVTGTLGGTTIAPSAQDTVVGSTATTEKELARARNSGQSDFFRTQADNLSTRAYQYVRSAAASTVRDTLPSAGRTLLRSGLQMYLEKQRNDRQRLR